MINTSKYNLDSLFVKYYYFRIYLLTFRSTFVFMLTYYVVKSVIAFIWYYVVQIKKNREDVQ